jgi:hypothetical protein
MREASGPAPESPRSEAVARKEGSMSTTPETRRIVFPTREEYVAAEEALQAAFNACEKASGALRELGEYDPADWRETLERPPTDADIAQAVAFLDVFEVELDQLRREYDAADRGLGAMSQCQREARWAGVDA